MLAGGLDTEWIWRATIAGNLGLKAERAMCVVGYFGGGDVGVDGVEAPALNVDVEEVLRRRGIRICDRVREGTQFYESVEEYDAVLASHCRL